MTDELKRYEAAAGIAFIGDDRDETIRQLQAVVASLQVTADDFREAAAALTARLAAVTAERDALIADNARLREALTEIEDSPSPDHWVPQYQHCVDVARAALGAS